MQGKKYIHIYIHIHVQFISPLKENALDINSVTSFDISLPELSKYMNWSDSVRVSKFLHFLLTSSANLFRFVIHGILYNSSENVFRLQ